jgi:hypothetical protein
VSGFEWSPEVDPDLMDAIGGPGAFETMLKAGLWPVASPRRRRPKRPCRWCVNRYAQPATHVAVFPRDMVWTGSWGSPPRRVRVCAFHGQFAARYSGVRLYRFRTV